MAGNSVLVVLTPNGRRESVKVTPNTSILQVLEDVCQKQNLDPSEWDLKHYNRIVELANSVRFSGLPNKATLEMVQNVKPRKESTINLGLQIENGKRLMHAFYPHQTLWDVIKHWETAGENIIAPPEPGLQLQPVCVYMRQEILGQEELEKRTLRSLGLTHGSACVRFLHRSEEQLKHQANVSAPLSRPVLQEPKDDIPLRKPEPAAVTATASFPTSTAPASPFANSNAYAVQSKDSDMQMETDQEPQEKAASIVSLGPRKIPEPELIEDMEVVERPRISKKGDLHIIGEHDAVVYHRDDVRGPNNYSIPDDFFQLTRGDIESIYRDLVAKRRLLEDAPLTTTTIKQQEHDSAVLRNLKAHPVSVIRVRFPDRLVLQGIFRGVDAVGAVENFVRSHLAHPTIDFFLYTSPPKTILLSDQRLVEQNLVGNAVVYFGSNDPKVQDRTHVLKTDLYNKLSCPDAIDEYLRSKSKDQKKPHIDSASMNLSTSSGSGSSSGTHSHLQSQPGTSSGSTSHAHPAPIHRAGTSSNTEKVPKWFKTTK